MVAGLSGRLAAIQSHGRAGCRQRRSWWSRPRSLQMVSNASNCPQRATVAGRPRSASEVQTPHASVIDQGTVFGISITPDDQTVVVTRNSRRGRAALNRTRRSSNSTAPLQWRKRPRGEQGKLNRITTVDATYFASAQIGRYSISPAIDRLGHHSVNSLTRRNTIASWVGSFEDVTVDRLHQWNGSTTRHSPPSAPICRRLT
jgi:hypothetical protein